MRADKVARRFTTPIAAPAYPPGRYRFTDREYLNIIYRTDPAALREAVPEPLEIDEPLVRFEIMHMGDVGAYGPYTEGGLAIPVRFGEERGEYLHAMYLDNFSATVAGREFSAYPKTLGEPRLRVEQGALIGTLDVTSERGRHRDDGLQVPRPRPRRGPAPDRGADLHAQGGALATTPARWCAT